MLDAAFWEPTVSVANFSRSALPLGLPRNPTASAGLQPVLLFSLLSQVTDLRQRGESHHFARNK
jgi:hypothetical protein